MQDIVWSDDKHSALIDSMFRNMYIPPLLFHLTKDENGEPVKVCMDGKQRLSSIQKFLDGQASHSLLLVSSNNWPCECVDPMYAYLTGKYIQFEAQFMSDKDPVTGKKFYFVRPRSAATSRKLVPEKYRTKFENMVVTCGTYSI